DLVANRERLELLPKRFLKHLLELRWLFLSFFILKIIFKIINHGCPRSKKWRYPLPCPEPHDPIMNGFIGMAYPKSLADSSLSMLSVDACDGESSGMRDATVIK